MFPLMFAAAAIASHPLPPAMPIDKKRWFNADDYPPELVRKGTEGSVRIDVSEGASVVVLGIAAVQSWHTGDVRYLASAGTNLLGGAIVGE